jgi:hypothetical protein
MPNSSTKTKTASGRRSRHCRRRRNLKTILRYRDIIILSYGGGAAFEHDAEINLAFKMALRRIQYFDDLMQ